MRKLAPLLLARVLAVGSLALAAAPAAAQSCTTIQIGGTAFINCSDGSSATILLR